MSSNLNKQLRVTMLVAAAACLSLGSSGALAAPTDLADGPLANATTTAILPNIMFDLDNSGSMSWDYMPDYVRHNGSNFFSYCRGPNSNNTLIVCEPGDPPYFASGFNSLYYNPTVRYTWPVNANGTLRNDGFGATAYTTALNWVSVASDGYGKQEIDNSASVAPTSTTCRSNVLGGTPQCPSYAPNAKANILSAYPERYWCKNNNDSAPGANCKRGVENNLYLYPNNEYRVMKIVYSNPYYYNVSVDWCSTGATSPNQNYGASNCSTKKTATFNKVRFSTWSRVDILPATVFPLKPVSRTDCAGARCTYAEEMANFANWFTWYRTRMQMTKSAIGTAFKDVRGTHKTGAALVSDPADPTFLHARVGLTTINSASANTVNIANFDATQRTAFYTKLYDAIPTGGTWRTATRPLPKSMVKNKEAI